MAVQFGRWNFEDRPPAQDYIERVDVTLAPYGPDSKEVYSQGGVTILYYAFHTTAESHRERQPYISPSGSVITWDGRLDNRADLISELHDRLTTISTDVDIAAAAYEKWNIKCFAKLIGDWALSIWNPLNRSLILATDPIGIRHLYYSIDSKQVTWSTILDPLVRFAGKTFELNEEYIAGWFSYFPAAHLTPYIGIDAVPPSSSVILRSGQRSVNKYWDFDPKTKVRYRTDGEYEEHFRAVFEKAVQRRLRSDRPILAELSGGMDSSSIVCMADTIIARGGAETTRLDTISWYDDSYDHIEPDTNEYHYFTKVEEKRGRIGCHIDLRPFTKDVDARKPFLSQFHGDRFAATPCPHRNLSEHFQRYAAFMKSEGHRVVLSGLGGDEVTAGDVPTPTSELQNLLAQARFFTLARQVNAWADKMKKPRLPLLWDAARGFCCRASTGSLRDSRPPRWLHLGFVHRNKAALRAYPHRMRLFGPLPSFQSNVLRLNVLRQVIAYWTLEPELPREVRFPYFDRDFLEFLYAVPREQIVGVGKRRFLMKRALVGIVPDEVLNRRRKGFMPQEQEIGSMEWPSSMAAEHEIVLSSLEIVDATRFVGALRRAPQSKGLSISDLKKALTLESWLRHLRLQQVLTNATPASKKATSRSRVYKALRGHSVQEFS